MKKKKNLTNVCSLHTNSQFFGQKDQKALTSDWWVDPGPFASKRSLVQYSVRTVPADADRHLLLDRSHRQKLHKSWAKLAHSVAKGAAGK